jgi:adenine-specific DNA methylase
LGGCQPAVAERRWNDADQKKRRYFAEFDLSKIKEIEAATIPHWHPTAAFPATFARWKTDLRLAGVERVDQLYTRRNLWALAAIRAQAIKSAVAPAALFALTAVALAASRMQRYSPNSGFPNMLLVGTYYLPPLGREVAVGDWYRGKLRALAKGYKAIRREMPDDAAACIATGDARRLDIPDASIDYIFTDPPYADAVQYGELNYVWESWLGTTDAWHEDEIVVSRGRGKDDAAWGSDLAQALVECFRVLKPGRWLSLCYHDASARRWALVQEAVTSAGFETASSSAAPLESNQRSFNQLQASKANQRDMVISFRKPVRRPGGRKIRPSAIQEDIDATVRKLIGDYLETHPGAKKDRVYDFLIGRLVQLGRMEPHDFEALFKEAQANASGTLRVP